MIILFHCTPNKVAKLFAGSNVVPETFRYLGIPTVKRQYQSYLVTTLQSVLDNMSKVIKIYEPSNVAG